MNHVYEIQYSRIIFLFIVFHQISMCQFDDDFFNERKSDSSSIKSSFIVETGIGLPIMTWGAEVNNNQLSILSPIEGRSGSGYKPNIYLKLGGESKFDIFKNNDDLELLFQYAIHGNTSTDIEWSGAQMPEVKIGERVWNAGIHLGVGLSYILNSSTFSFTPFGYIPGYMVLPNYIVNPQMDKELYESEWLMDAERHTVYSRENFFIDFSDVSSFTLGFGGELRVSIKNKFYLKAEYFQMNVSRAYRFRTEYFQHEPVINGPDESLLITVEEMFQSNYNITNLRFGIGMMF